MLVMNVGDRCSLNVDRTIKCTIIKSLTSLSLYFVLVWFNLYIKRDTLKNIYDKREEILEEPINSNYRNAGLRLRRKLPHQQKIFEDRLASVALQSLNQLAQESHAAKITVDLSSLTEVAKD